MKAKKTQEQRQSEVDKLLEQFLELGIPLEIPGTQEFIKITKEFVQQGYSSSGIIKFPEYNRILEYVLSLQPHIVSRAIFVNTAKKPSVNLVTV